MGHRVSESVVIKSPTDRRSYRIIHLSNGLTALLVHDPEINPDGFTPQEESNGRAVGADVEEGDEDGDLEEDGEDDFDEEEYESEGEEGEEDGEEGEEDGEQSEQKRKKGTAPTKKVFFWLFFEREGILGVSRYTTVPRGVKRDFLFSFSISLKFNAVS